MSDPSQRLGLAEMRAIAAIAELPISDERLSRLLPQMRAILAGLDSLDALDLDDIEPEMIFRAAWEVPSAD